MDVVLQMHGHYGVTNWKIIQVGGGAPKWTALRCSIIVSAGNVSHPLCMLLLWLPLAQSTIARWLHMA